MVGSRAAEPSVVDLESVSEYKRGLYDKLHSTGILDNLKSHLRARILSKLSGQDKVSLAAQRGAHEGGHDGIISRVLDTLFTDYLRHNGFDYTLSVFLPESGLQSPSSALSLQEVLRMLHVDETSQMGRAIRDRASAASGDAGQSNTAGCLSTLILGSLAHVNSSKPLHEAETQTWGPCWRRRGRPERRARGPENRAPPAGPLGVGEGIPEGRLRDTVERLS